MICFDFKKNAFQIDVERRFVLNALSDEPDV